MTKLFRQNIENMSGYVPGEQPKNKSLIKLNTNENPYPPSPAVKQFLDNFITSTLRLYPDPTAENLRTLLADKFKLNKNNFLIGNGSDDILTIVTRTFLGEHEKAVCFEPSYSLYPVLANIQNSQIIKIPLDENNFSVPEDLINPNTMLFDHIKDAKIFFIARPNAPTGTNINLDFLEKLCELFPGMIFIDEAYTDFSASNTLSLLNKFENIIISRTLSKSYSLAGLRVGWAIASENIISGMMKAKDSYNVGTLPQLIAIEAVKDEKYFNSNLEKINKTKSRLIRELLKMNFKVTPSEANFVFVSPPKENAEDLFYFLKEKNILVRYFKGNLTEKYLRITIGTDKEIDTLLNECRTFTKTVN